MDEQTPVEVPERSRVLRELGQQSAALVRIESRQEQLEKQVGELRSTVGLSSSPPPKPEVALGYHVTRAAVAALQMGLGALLAAALRSCG